jgi:hypothetical protein
MLGAETKMSHVVEADEQGAIVLSGEMLGSKPHARYQVDVQGESVTLRPMPMVTYPPNWHESTPQERVESFLRMVEEFEKLPQGPSLSDEALRRENIYD